jgi:hypothetical protein
MEKVQLNETELKKLWLLAEQEGERANDGSKKRGEMTRLASKLWQMFEESEMLMANGKV